MNKLKLLNVVMILVILGLVYKIYQKETISEQSSAPIAAEEVVVKSEVAKSTDGNKISLGVTADIHPKPAFVIGSYDKDGVPNIMTASWSGVVNSHPLKIAVSMRPATYSYHNLTETKSFTINVPSSKEAKYVDYVGRRSGKDENKFETTGLTPVRGEFVNAPYIKEFPIAIECKVTEVIELGSHRMFIGEVVDTKASPSVLNESGKVDVTKLDPIVAGNRNYWGLGEFAGRRGDIYKQITGEPLKVKAATTSGKTLETIFNRKSVRHFTSEKVSREQLNLLVKAAMAAPSAVNKQPWDFVIVDDRATLDKLAEGLPYASMLKSATAAVVVCGNMNKALDGDSQQYWIQDCSAATQNLLLAAESIGLGAVWTGVFPSNERVAHVKNTLSIPETSTPLNVIPIGYPTGEDKPKDKWKESNVHYTKW